MFYRRILFTFLILIACTKTFAVVFVVISNADSGPGTFRDALTQAAANGSATQDIIQFNLADISQGGRTITILSQLPNISPNLVIDGSTQPGPVFGVSTSRISLVFNSTGQPHFSALNIINAPDVKIFGLYIILSNSFTPPDKPNGILINGSDNVQLGDVQKGNVIAGFYSAVNENGDGVSQSTGLILKSNFFDIQSDGLALANDFAPVIQNVYGNVIIGGGSAEEGNLFAKGMSLVPGVNNILSSLLFQNNKCGVNYNLTEAFPSATVDMVSGFNISTGIINPSDANMVINIEDNVICTAGDHSQGFNVGELNATVNLVRNYIGVDKQKKQLGSSTFGIYVQICKEVHIGDNNINDANYVGYCMPIFAETTGNLTFTKNSFFCTPHSTVYNYDPPGLVRTLCNLLKTLTTGVSGTATPNALVDLYYSDVCKSCAPQTYFASVTADGAGNWSYNGVITNTVIANATINDVSSEFTSPNINTDNINITDACGGTGSITGIKAYGAINLEWIDSARKVVGNAPDLLNIKPGEYKLIIGNGECGDSTAYLTIAPKFALDSTNVVVTNPACGNTAGSILGLKMVNTDHTKLVYHWTDAGGNLVGDTIAIKNLPAGTYSFVVSGKDGCTQTYGPVVLPQQNLAIAPPLLNDLRLCSAGDGVLRVNNPVAGHGYRLYDSETSSTPLDQQQSGVFKITATINRFYYVSANFYACESARTRVAVSAGINRKPMINSFTPNGDGINDYWAIPGIETFPGATIQVFSRSGQKVYGSIGYAVPFDGTYSGKQLPAGVYYYVINLASYCNILSGSLTIIR